MLDQPSRLWERLGAAHARELEAYGFDQIKRRQALRYFTWRWNLASIRHSKQMRYLLRRSSPRTWLRCASAHIDVSSSEWSGVAWAKHDRWLYAFAIRMLWEYARPRDPLHVLDLAEPVVGGPFPVYWDGRLISQDLANGALESAAIARGLDGKAPQSIVEVGAGYGRTAFILLNLYPKATYTIVDIEPASTISRWYLGQLFPADRVRWLTPSEVAEQADGSFDLGLSISSLQEMTAAQMRGYLLLFDRLVAGGTVYLKQWREWYNPDDRITLSFLDYPIPDRWRRTYVERAPVQDAFMQAAWRIP